MPLRDSVQEILEQTETREKKKRKRLLLTLISYVIPLILLISYFGYSTIKITDAENQRNKDLVLMAQIDSQIKEAHDSLQTVSRILDSAKANRFELLQENLRLQQNLAELVRNDSIKLSRLENSIKILRTDSSKTHDLLDATETELKEYYVKQ